MSKIGEINLEKLISVLGTYNILNYLFPGVVFSFLMKIFFSIDLFMGDSIVSLFIFYFYGMTISRIGSLIIEPLFKYFYIVKFTSYGEFIQASKKDSTISILSETNNTYRTVVSLFFILLVYKICRSMSYDFTSSIGSFITILGFLILYTYSYRKQSIYIQKRVNHNKDNAAS